MEVIFGDYNYFRAAGYRTGVQIFLLFTKKLVALSLTLRNLKANKNFKLNKIQMYIPYHFFNSIVVNKYSGVIILSSSFTKYHGDIFLLDGLFKR